MEPIWEYGIVWKYGTCLKILNLTKSLYSVYECLNIDTREGYDGTICEEDSYHIVLSSSTWPCKKEIEGHNNTKEKDI